MENNTFTKVRWHQTWWGAVILGVAIFLLFSSVIFLFLVGFLLLKPRVGGSVGGSVGSVATSRGLSEKRVAIETADDPQAGNPNAEVVVVEFVDYKCPTCKAVFPIMKQVLEKYGYKIKFIVRDLPVETSHPGATDLAALAYCANLQGRFWEMHNLLFINQDSLPQTLSDKELKFLSDSASTDLVKIKECLTRPDVKVEIGKDFSDGLKYGAKGTPAFFINGTLLEIVPDFNGWENILKNL